MLLESLRNSFTLLLPGQVLILAQKKLFYDIANRALSRDPPYTTIALQPPVSAAATGAQGTFHVSALGPSALQTPNVHTKRPQLCCSMLSCSAPCRNSLCFSLMSFDDSTRGLVVFTFSLLPPSQVWSVHCRLNFESFFDSCSVGIDSPCGTVLRLST